MLPDVKMEEQQPNHLDVPVVAAAAEEQQPDHLDVPVVAATAEAPPMKWVVIPGTCILQPVPDTDAIAALAAKRN